MEKNYVTVMLLGKSTHQVYNRYKIRVKDNPEENYYAKVAAKRHGSKLEIGKEGYLTIDKMDVEILFPTPKGKEKEVAIENIKSIYNDYLGNEIDEDVKEMPTSKENLHEYVDILIDNGYYYEEVAEELHESVDLLTEEEIKSVAKSIKDEINEGIKNHKCPKCEGELKDEGEGNVRCEDCWREFKVC